MVSSASKLGRARVRKLGWRFLYGFLASRFDTREWLFMNYGYVGGGSDAALSHEDEPNRHFIQMYAHALGLAGSVAGCDVLEVGCGRGGGSDWIARTQGVRSMTGVELSGKAAALCERLHDAPLLRFRQGDAERLPFPDATFDVVLNVESCHHYPSLPTFLGEVERVLRPGGAFCVATYWDRAGRARFERALEDAPLEVVRQADITPRVMDALRATNAMKATLIRRHVPWWLRPLLNHFTAVEGSNVYRGFMDGRITYLAALLRKRRSA